MAELANPETPPDDLNWVPKVDLEFKTDDEAYNFYNNYAKIIGFSVRKSWVNKRVSGVIISRTFVCYKEGFQGNKKDETEVKSPRPNERTGCLAHLTVKITVNGNYRVSEFHPMHNHELVAWSETQNLKSHRPPNNKRNRSVNQNSNPNLGSINFVSIEESEGQNWAPKINMEFENDDSAYDFYSGYGKKLGFDVRRAWVNRRNTGVIISRTYVCHKEGYYGNKREGNEIAVHRIRPGERTGCRARMVIKLSKSGKYRVSEFESLHNHDLADARTAHTLKAFRVSNSIWNSSSGKDCKVTSSNQSALISVQVGLLMQHMQERQFKDPSFYYAIKIGSGEKINSVFFTDGRSIVDFCYFGDAVCFSTNFKANNNSRTPLVFFYGVNHHKQIVIFGSALIYENTVETYKWLFNSFKNAMYGKQPRVVLTDYDLPVLNAAELMWRDTIHRICVWQLYQRATKCLARVFEGSRTFQQDFAKCLFDCEEREEFVEEWGKMLESYDLGENLWLRKLFEEREKWSVAYGRENFCADMRNTQRDANFESVLKENLNLETNLLQFLRNYEKVVDGLREREFRIDPNLSKVITPCMSNQAARFYTPSVFQIFQKEFEMSMDCMVFKLKNGLNETVNEFKVTSEGNPKEYIVKIENSNEIIISCSCKKFEFDGIQCRHVLKALDLINVKELPEKYILKRWSKDAKNGLLNEIFGVDRINPNLSKPEQFRVLSRVFNVIAARAVESLESYVLVENSLDKLFESACGIPCKRTLEELESS